MTTQKGSLHDPLVQHFAVGSEQFGAFNALEYREAATRSTQAMRLVWAVYYQTRTLRQQKVTFLREHSGEPFQLIRADH